MTIATSTARADYAGDTVSTVFAVPFYFLDGTHLEVVKRDAAGVETVLVKDVHYTVAGAAVPSGGSVTMLSAPASGEQLTIRRKVPITQTLDYVANDPFPAESHERGLDKAAMIDQQQAEEISRSLRLPVTEGAAPPFPAKAVRSGKFMGFDADGLPIALAGVGNDGALREDLAAPGGSALAGFSADDIDAIARSVLAKLRELPRSVIDYGAARDGITNDTVAFTKARASTGGRYHVPSGTYVVDASPSIWGDLFTADDDTFVIISGVTYEISNAYAGRLRYRAASAVKLDVVDAVTGNIVMYLQNGAPGTATGFYRGLAVTTDSHFLQAQPATDGGSTDLLFQRSTANADAAGNRFNVTFEEDLDRLIFSYATAASGFPAFDTFMRIVAGTSASLEFPGLRARFSEGVHITSRADGNFGLEAVSVAADRVAFRDEDTGTELASFTAEGFAVAGFLYFDPARTRFIGFGNGTPEGNLDGVVGCLWMRANGGAGSTLYVKESGSGPTGWVAK